MSYDPNRYFKYLLQKAADTAGESGDFNRELIRTVALECLAIISDVKDSIPGDEKWTPLGIAESIELQIAGQFEILLNTLENDDEQQNPDSTTAG